MDTAASLAARQEPSIVQEILRNRVFHSLKQLPPKVGARLLRIVLASPELQFSRIDLSECSINAESMQIILEGLFPLSKYVRHLYLDSNAITSAFCPTLLSESVCRQITQLSLADNFLGDDGAIAVADALKVPGCAIEYLDLSSNNIHSRGAGALAGAINNSSLTWLSLQFNLIGDAGFRSLLVALRRNKTVKSLFMAHNFITDRSQAALMSTLGINSTLSELHLRDNFLTVTTLKTIGGLVQNRFARIQIQPVVALAYGFIPRLGRASPILSLPREVLQCIRDMVVLKGYPTPSYIFTAEPWSSLSDTDDDGVDDNDDSDFDGW